MHFTQEDYRKIEAWLYQRVVRDTDFPNADPLSGAERMPIIQDGRNKTVGLNDLVKQVAMMRLPDFYNVTTASKKSWLTLKEAVSLVPVAQRKLGLTITFHNENGNWLIYQFKGDSVNQWDSLNYWNNIIQQALEELVVYPDEEDITGVRDGNRTFLKFKNREYNPEEFSGMGMIILRKNLVGTEACAIDDEDHWNNILTQDMINQENTVYIVEYDFDLDGKVISIPKGCTLWFQGGSINNGTIYLQETAILGAFEFADMGTAKLFGKFNTGQVMTFSNDSYKAKEGGYFTASTKDSSATIEEDAKNDRETFYDINSNAYKEKVRQELRWWNGEEWILILDITDYQEIKSIINDLIEKHNAEMAACYKYFKARCYALEVRVTDAERRLDEHDKTLADHETRIGKAETNITNTQNNITQIEENIQNIEGDITTINENITNISGDITNINNNIENINQSITNLGDTINNLDQTINNHLEQYFETHVVGANSVIVNGTKYTPDAQGNITLPNYPEPGGGTADKTKGKLTFTGAAEEVFDGSKDVTVNIPQGGGGGGETAKEPLTIKQGSTTLGTYDGTVQKTITIPEFPTNIPTADKVNHKLKFTGAVTAEYDGSQEVSVNIPTGGGGGTTQTNQPLKFTGASTASYDGTSQVTVNIPTRPTLSELGPKTLTVTKHLNERDNLTYNGLADVKIPLHSALNGDYTNGIVLWAGYVYRSTNQSNWVVGTKYSREGISGETITQEDYAVKIKVNTQSGYTLYGRAAIATFHSNTVSAGTATTGGRNRSNGTWMQAAWNDSEKAAYIKSWRTDNKDNDAVDNDCARKGGALLSFNLVIIGHIEKS